MKIVVNKKKSVKKCKIYFYSPIRIFFTEEKNVLSNSSNTYSCLYF